jgi:hypothetical protein
MMRGKVQFSPDDPNGLEALRPAIFQALRDKRITRVPKTREEVECLRNYIDFADGSQVILDRALLYTQEILWELMVERVLVPGRGRTGLELPDFRLTDHGTEALKREEYNPYDPEGFLDLFAGEVGPGYETALEYLKESLHSFRTGCLLASSMMLGIASESVFLTFCGKLLEALENHNEHEDFSKILSLNSMKKKQDWVQTKLEKIGRSDRKALPEDMALHLLGIFSLIRLQRNEVGHPQDNIPDVSRCDALGNLYLFPRFCKSVNQAISYFTNHKV